MIKVPSLSPGAVKAEKKVELAPMSATTGDRLALGSSPITNQGMSVAVHPPLLRMMRMRMALLVWIPLVNASKVTMLLALARASPVGGLQVIPVDCSLPQVAPLSCEIR